MDSLPASALGVALSAVVVVVCVVVFRRRAPRSVKAGVILCGIAVLILTCSLATFVTLGDYSHYFA